MKSIRNGLWYIGFTADPRQRQYDHKSRRKDLYCDGWVWKILAKCKSIEEAASKEAIYIRKYKTMWPGGNNLQTGGIKGVLIKKVKEHGPKCIPQPLESGSIFSAKTLAKMSQAKKGRAAKNKGVPWTQQIKDNIAAAKIAKRILSGVPLTPAGVADQRRKAWKRHHAGLPPIPGMEHYLLQPQHAERLPDTEDTRKKKSEGSKQMWARRKKDRNFVHPLKGRKRRLWTQAEKDNISAGRVRCAILRGNEMDSAAIRIACQRAKQRAAQALPPIPGTEIFANLQVNIKLSEEVTRAHQAEYQRIMVQRVNEWRRAYAIKQGWRHT